MDREPGETLEQYYSAMETMAHRVRHVFAVIRSMVARSAASRDEAVQDYAAHLDGRIEAFSRAQMRLIQQPESEVELEDLLRDELLSQAAVEGVQYTLHGPRVVLPVRVAEVLTMAFHELATNATKFGAFAHEGGTLDVSWRVEHLGMPRVDLVWLEQGVRGGQRERDGFGFELVMHQAPYEIGGSVVLDVTETGLRCDMTFPIAAERQKEEST